MSTLTTFEAKIAKSIHDKFTSVISRLSSSSPFAGVNLNESLLVKAIERRLSIAYRAVLDEKNLIEEPYSVYGSVDSVENALLAIKDLITGGYCGNRNYLFKRLDFLTTSALNDLKERNHTEWIQRINQEFCATSDLTKSAQVIRARKRKRNVQTRLRDKSGRFIKNKKKTNRLRK